MKHIVLCADDYGQNSAISQAIVELLKTKHLSAVSCMVTDPDWATHAKELAPFKGTIDIGLHFNLTEGKLLSKEFPDSISLKRLIIKANSRGLSKKAIVQELRAQLDRFTDTMNQLPDFIDGHQHVQQLPIVRDALFEVYEERLRAHGTYVRCTYESGVLSNILRVAYVKQLIIQILGGGRSFKQALIEHKIPHNPSFTGIYNFENYHLHHQLFLRFLDQIDDCGLIMCHPGLMGDKEKDPITAARHYEYCYFSSKQFLDDLDTKPVKFMRFSELPKK
jgi:predicted glycoside hydrolase/deacetylase ChbG (UPF0249 family)